MRAITKHEGGSAEPRRFVAGGPQVKEEAEAVAQHCGAGPTVTALTGEGHAAARRAAVSAAGQLVVATPGRIAQVRCAVPTPRRWVWPRDFAGEYMFAIRRAAIKPVRSGAVPFCVGRSSHA